MKLVVRLDVSHSHFIYFKKNIENIVKITILKILDEIISLVSIS